MYEEGSVALPSCRWLHGSGEVGVDHLTDLDSFVDFPFERSSRQLSLAEFYAVDLTSCGIQVDSLDDSLSPHGLYA